MIELTKEQKDVVVAVYKDGGAVVWNGILQGEEIGTSWDLERMGLMKVTTTQYHGNMRARLTDKGRKYAVALVKAGHKSPYKVVS